MFQFDVMKAVRAAQGHKVISFDIFDTLIKRNVSNPACIFDVVEERYNLLHPKDELKGFRGARIAAERDARAMKPTGEVTLDEIYDKISHQPQLSLTEESKMRLKDIEIETEVDYCEPNVLVVDVYDRCMSLGMDVIIVSDMYLPKVVIERMLKKCGIDGYKKLYLSSEVGVQKRTGMLYDYVIDDMCVKASDILHFGDRKKADNLIPRSKGMESFYVDPVMRQTAFLTKKDLQEGRTSLLPFVNNGLMRIRDKGEAFQWGYETLGPLLYGFAEWVHKQILEMEIEETYFLARDMNLVIQAYHKMYGDEGTSYLEISRASLRRAYVAKKGDINSIFDTMGRGSYSLCTLLGSLGIGDADDMCARAGVSPNEKVESRTDLLWRFPALNACVLEALGCQEDYAEDYLAEHGLFGRGRLALVDIGWHGTIQNMLETITGRKFEGLYFGSTRRENYPEMSMSGYWLCLEEREALPIAAMMKILEVMLLNDVGTVTGYAKEGEGILPIYGECEMEDYSFVKEFQSGAMHFVDDYSGFVGETPEAIPAAEAGRAYERLAFSPTVSQARRFSSLRYEDGRLYGLADVRQSNQYLLHPKLLLEDYKNAQWKEGFIKQVMPACGNPYGIDMAIKKIVRASKVARSSLASLGGGRTG